MDDDVDKSDGSEERRSYPIARVLPVALAALVIGTVLPILATTYVINRENAAALLSARADILVDGLENQLRGLLDPVALQLETARDYIAARELDMDDEARFQSYVEGLLDGAPQVAGVGVIRPDGTMRRWERGHGGAIEEPASLLPLADEALAAAPNETTVSWSAPFVSLVLSDTILNPRITLRRDGEVYGVLTVGVSGARLSDYIAELSRDKVTGFVIYDRDKLIASPFGSDQSDEPTSIELPTIFDSGSPILRDMWIERNPLTQTNQLVRSQGHWATVEGGPYAYFYREIEGYAPEGLLVGVAIPTVESRWFRWAATISALLGLVLLIVSVVIAAKLGRRIATPVVELETALERFQTLDFRDVSLPSASGSRISEWRRSARRLGDAAKALRSFNQYVPGTLARRLMSNPENAAVAREREVAVMFIDLERFTEFSARRPAAVVASNLNAVFALIGPIIEESGGVIDKYTGDGLMAFWGAPDDLSDPLRRAVSAALRISDAVENERPPDVPADLPRMRIGIGQGPAVAGNLGFEGRWNYTLVGGTVNAAQKTEQSLRAVRSERKVVIGLPAEYADRVDWSALEAEPTVVALDGRRVMVF